MRNGRAVRSGKPAKCHATDERVLLIGTRSADHIMASSQSGCSNKAEYMTAPDHRESVRFLLHRGRRPYMALGIPRWHNRALLTLRVYAPKWVHILSCQQDARDLTHM